MKNVSILLLLVLMSIQCYSQEKMEVLFYYESNDTVPLKIDTAFLFQLISEPFDSILLEGHSDDVGSDSYNLILSSQRVEYMKNYLRTLNVNEYVVKTTYHGERRPKYDNKSEESRSRNRRVKMIIYKPDLVESLTMTPGSVLRENDAIEGNIELYTTLKDRLSYQYFIISNAKDTVITTNAGVSFYFPKGCFRSTCDSTTISIQEYNDKKSMILSNIQTISNERLIYSDGMLEVKASCNDQELSLIDGKKYTMLFPRSDEINESDAIGFYGHRDSVTNQINWLPTTLEPLEFFSGDSFWACGRRRKSCPIVDWFRSDKKKWERASLAELNEERQRIRAKYKGVDFDKFTGITNSEVEFYVFQASRLGLINVDYFWDLEPEELTNQRIMLTEAITRNCDVIMVFKGRRSLQSIATKTSSHFEFTKVPKGETVQIVVLKLGGDEKIKMKIEELMIGEKTELTISLNPVNSFEDMDKILNQLN